MPRALTHDEIKKKEQVIISGAKNLFRRRTFHSFRIEDLAQSLNMSKGIIFKYFKTKEILFLKMLESEYEISFNKLDEAVKEHPEMTKEEFFEFLVEHFEETLDHDSLFLKLMSIKSSILERNLNYDFALKYKQQLHDLTFEFSQNVLLKVSGFSLNTLVDILAIQRVLIQGYLSNDQRESVIKNVVEDANLDMFQLDYREVTVKAFKVYLENI